MAEIMLRSTSVEFLFLKWNRYLLIFTSLLFAGFCIYIATIQGESIWKSIVNSTGLFYSVSASISLIILAIVIISLHFGLLTMNFTYEVSLEMFFQVISLIFLIKNYLNHNSYQYYQSFREFQTSTSDLAKFWKEDYAKPRPDKYKAYDYIFKHSIGWASHFELLTTVFAVQIIGNFVFRLLFHYKASLSINERDNYSVIFKQSGHVSKQLHEIKNLNAIH